MPKPTKITYRCPKCDLSHTDEGAFFTGKSNGDLRRVFEVKRLFCWEDGAMMVIKIDHALEETPKIITKRRPT